MQSPICSEVEDTPLWTVDACAGRGWSLDWCDIVTIVEGDHGTMGRN